MSTTSNKRQNTELSNGQDVSKRRRDRAGGAGVGGEKRTVCEMYLICPIRFQGATEYNTYFLEKKKGKSEIPRVNWNY